MKKAFRKVMITRPVTDSAGSLTVGKVYELGVTLANQLLRGGNAVLAGVAMCEDLKACGVVSVTVGVDVDTDFVRCAKIAGIKVHKSYAARRAEKEGAK